MSSIVKWWKALMDMLRRGVCNNCKHLTFGVVSNKPLCMRGTDKLFLKRRSPAKFSCDRWEKGEPKEAW